MIEEIKPKRKQVNCIMPNMQIRTDLLKLDMVIKADVYTNSGVVIVPKDTVVSKEVCSLLAKHHIAEVTIGCDKPVPQEKAPAPQVWTPNLDPEKLEDFKQTFRITEDALSQSLKDIVYRDEEVDIPLLLSMVNSIVEKSDNEMNLCDMLFFMKESESSLYSHAINTSLFGQLLAKWANLSEKDIEAVGIAGLLHDIGILKCLEEGEVFTTFHDEMEKNCCENHVAYSYNLCKDKAIDIRIKQAILTHHERLDESGFPLGVSQKNINEISRILAIADIYDTLTMAENDVNRLSPFEALSRLEDISFGKLDPRLLMIFLEHITQNFIQHKVLLSTGDTGSIVMINKMNLPKPLIQLDNGGFIDLSSRRDVFIQKVLN